MASRQNTIEAAVQAVVEGRGMEHLQGVIGQPLTAENLHLLQEHFNQTGPKFAPQHSPKSQISVKISALKRTPDQDLRKDAVHERPNH